MSLQFIHRYYLKYNKGNGFLCCHVDAQHAAPPKADLFTDKIVTNLIDQTGCAGIIGTVSRIKADLNRSPDGSNNLAIEEYRNTIKEIVMGLGILDNINQITKPYLHLSFHGMKDVHHGPYAIEVGTLGGQTCSEDMMHWFQDTLTKLSRKTVPLITIIFDKKFVGDSSIAFHRVGDGKMYPGYGVNYHTFQIEIARTLRECYLAEIVELFSQVILDFQAKFMNEI